MLLGVLGLSIWYAVDNAGQSGLGVPPPLPEIRPAAPPARARGEAPGGELDAPVAMGYAIAMQEGHCDGLIARTWWMQERMQHARRMGENELTAREELCERVLDRRVEDNRLRAEGVRDAYVFTPGAKVTAVARDEGRDDLAKPVDYRIWIEVEYPMESQALHDDAGRPIRSLRAGLNISPEGFVLKAGVLGTAELDWESIAYWESETERADGPPDRR